MYLTNHEERILKGEEGEVKQKAMEILVALGEIFGASKLIPISSAQISGISYKSIGEAGINFLKSFSGAKFSVLTTLNPCGMDLDDWMRMGVPISFANRQREIIGIFRNMGAIVSCTCTPYLAGNLPKFGDHIAWSESSAVVYANSVIGARTNREGGPSALAAAIIGKTPYYGLHLKENRSATIKVRIEVELTDSTDYSALGYWVGKTARRGIPFFVGAYCDRDSLKSLGAAMAASGGISMFHMDNVTPEAGEVLNDRVEELKFGDDELKQTYESLSTFSGKEVDLVALGCPHTSLNEIAQIAAKLRGKRIRRGRLWIFTSKAVKLLAERSGLLEEIENAGGEVYTDSCMVVSPIEEMGIETMAVNSAKAAFYARSLSKIDVIFCKLDECLKYLALA